VAKKNGVLFIRGDNDARACSIYVRGYKPRIMEETTVRGEGENKHEQKLEECGGRGMFNEGIDNDGEVLGRGRTQM
jgi:hypothetical protein